jgi:hypothetical protein
VSESAQTVVPTTKQYIMATGKQTLELLKSAATVIPVPLLKDAIGVAIKIIEVLEVRGISIRGRFTYNNVVYQEASTIQQKVKELQETIAHLMVTIVANVTVKYEEGSEVVVKAAERIEKDIEDLLRCASYHLTGIYY